MDAVVGPVLWSVVPCCAAVSFVSCQVKDIFEDQHQLQLDTYDLGTGALES